VATALLIISCSQRKKVQHVRVLKGHPSVEVPLPAIEAYDGPVYRTLRKFRSEQSENKLPNNLRVLILSAKYGLIFPETEIETYDLKMTAERAREMKLDVHIDLQRCLLFYEVAYRGLDEVFINLGKTYKLVLEGFAWENLSPTEASGGIGQRVSQMKTWLEGLG